MSGRLRSQFLWVVSGRVGAALIQAVTFLVLARSLQPELFGFFAAVFGVATVAQTVVDLGLSTMLIRERAANPKSPVIAGILKLNDRLSLALSVLVGALLGALGAYVDQNYLLLLPLAIWIGAERNADVWLGVAFADGDVRVNVSNILIRRVLTLVILISLSSLMSPLLAFALGAAAASLLSSLFAHRFVRARLEPYVAVSLRRLLSESWPYWLNSLATQMRNLDVTLVAIAATSVQAGFFSAGSRLTGPLRILPTSLASVLLPAASRSNSSSIRRLIYLVIAATGGLALIYGGAIFFVPFFLPLLLGEGYTGAIPAVQIIFAGLAFAGSASLFGALLQGVGLKHFVANAAVVMTISCLIGVAFASSFAGAVGAAIGLSLSFLIQSVMLFIRLVLFVKRAEPNRT